ncbi:MAG: hypothetical protein ACKOWE_05415 [Micrococcales bacterium]
MAGTVMGAGIFLSVGLLSGLTISAGEIALNQNRLQVLADTVAISVSESLQGLNAGIPCESAEDFARFGYAELRECLIVGQSVHISLAVNSLGIVLSAEAIAEPLL